MFVVALFTIAKVWKQPNCSSTDNKVDIYNTTQQTSEYNNKEADSQI